MPHTTEPSAAARPVRTAADAYVQDFAHLEPVLATALGLPFGQDRLPDLSPAGQQELDDLRRATLAKLAGLEQAAAADGGFADADERRCARLLRERLTTELAVSDIGEHMRTVSNIFGAQEHLREAIMLMPSATAEDWAVIARRMAAMPEALAGYRASLAEGARRGLYAAGRQVRTVAGQLAEWQASGDGKGWFATYAVAAEGPDSLRADLGHASAVADEAVASLRSWLLTEYLPGAESAPDGVGAERYRVQARNWNGADLDLAEAYEWGWSEYRRIWAEMEGEAIKILPGSGPKEAMDYLETHGEIIDGEAAVLVRLQGLMDEAIANLDGTHFDLADPIKVVKARIAPSGSAAAAYYTGPSLDFSRPGQTWLPTLGKTSFPMWGLISTWYHEGVPGHHLQIAQWTYLAKQLSTYQTSLADVSACSEGWALYAERLMDELGFFTTPGVRMGYLEGQLHRAIRVIVDIGMHLSMQIPAASPMFAGQRWTPERGVEFSLAHSGLPRDYIESEIDRYLSMPGQAISYKLGERAWLSGRAAASAAHGTGFDLKSWHMAALSLGSLGLDDLADELSRL